ncbi:3-oxoacyl-ACP reductase FabG [Micromonospora sp. WMMD882]|uniref:SDR family NAD(P)-dependent oxidoreductase n=1 Tax=Micromonospora sp. WMMD882 TaxID=3015151 RepID=UPI00248CF0FD|nr:3-oxoacyl-ACP reductase family protein [Micromonospora sp. WMMD882]WBB81912.1 3-oxoacyl-ACP reductase FabG [Micromonospora sp. WMMD882]
MKLPLIGKAALVTGGSRGIGRATALRLAEDGADVTFTFQRQAEQAAEVVTQIKALGRRALAVRADSADPAAVRAAVEQAVAEFGRLDILVNNAGTGVGGPIEETPLEDVDRLLAVNLRAPVVATQTAVRHLSDGGRIINIGSSNAERVPRPGLTLYALTKAGLIGMTKGLARDLGPRAITANVICVGPVDTDFNPADGPDAPAKAARLALGRFGEPADVAAMVAHLAGPAGRWITGASITVDGGANT